ncbi:hypothetical protein TNCV_1930031 [Trichonephila clavipes]|nr:hypothetical protein TNCV_1930031 [Trichonephila clavipes]
MKPGRKMRVRSGVPNRGPRATKKVGPSPGILQRCKLLEKVQLINSLGEITMRGKVRSDQKDLFKGGGGIKEKQLQRPVRIGDDGWKGCESISVMLHGGFKIAYTGNG